MQSIIVNPAPNPVRVDIADPVVSQTELIPPTDPNLPPVVSIGQDQTIQLPVNSVTLKGTATDPEGGPLSYLWAQVSGPAAQHSDITQPNLILSGLTEGVYVFKLTVFDNKGASATDTSTITVKPAIVVIPPGGNWIEKYRNSFEVVADLDPFGNGQITNGTIVPAPGRTGNCFKAWVKKGQGQTHGGYRDEWQGPSSLTPDGVEIIKAFDMLVQSLATKSAGLIEQDHGTVNGTSGERSIWADSGLFKSQRNISGASGPNIYGPKTKPIPLNQWMHIEIHSKFSKGTDGYVRVYIDDMANAFYDSGLTKTTDGADPGGQSQYPKLGINWFVSPESDIVVLYDNLVISHLVP